MRLSEKRMQEVYNGISEPITETRIRIARKDSVNELDPVEVDEWLFHLEREIWHRVHKALNLDKPA